MIKPISAVGSVYNGAVLRRPQFVRTQAEILAGGEPNEPAQDQPKTDRGSKIHRFARWLVAMLICVIAIKPRAKTPAVTSWTAFQQRLPCRNELETWFGPHQQEANLAIVTGKISGLVVVDLDSPDALIWAKEHLPEPAVRVLTGQKDEWRGQHWFYLHPGYTVPNKARVRLADGQTLEIDIRGDGGYVLAPGSVHPSGVVYQTMGGQGCWKKIRSSPVFDADWFLQEPASATSPPFFGQSGVGGNPTEAALQRARQYVQAIPGECEGSRNQKAFLVCARLSNDFGLGDSPEAYAFAQSWNERNSPPLPERELLAVWRSALKSASQPPGNKLAASPRSSRPYFPTGPEPNPEAADAPTLPEETDWPVMTQEAYYGLTGEIVRKIGPESEADESALMGQTLVLAGHQIGRGPHFTVEASQHYLNLFLVVAGETAMARKGTSLDQVFRFGRQALQDEVPIQTVSGLGSGEGLITLIRDDPGETGSDFWDKKRFLVEEPEFAGVLRVGNREGSLLSPILRKSWDGKQLANTVKAGSFRSTDHHVSIIGHITMAELEATLSGVDIANGFGNRILWLAARRSKLLPFGGSLEDRDLEPLALRYRAAVLWARGLRHRRISMTPGACRLWERVYPDLSDPGPGISGMLLARGTALVRRLALVYAMLDMSEIVSEVHLRAALAVWDYNVASVRRIFGDRLGHEVADMIIDELREFGDEGLTRSQIRDLFHRNKSSAAVGKALELLRRHRKATKRIEPPGGRGRPTERWFAIKVVKCVGRSSEAPSGGQGSLDTSIYDINDINITCHEDPLSPAGCPTTNALADLNPHPAPCGVTNDNPPGGGFQVHRAFSPERPGCDPRVQMEDIPL